MRRQAEVDQVLELVAEGQSDLTIARETSVPRSTVRDWRRGKGLSVPRPNDSPCIHAYGELPAAQYAYLLGTYLGDGCISPSRRGVWKLRLFLDASYPLIIEEAREAIDAVMPGQHARIFRRRHGGWVEVWLYSKHWPCLIPQHGPGKKHTRRIELVRWQREIVERNREDFLRGLIHSDGCRVVANDRGVASVRYHFSNRSDDIKALYCESLTALNIPWTRPCKQQIAVYRKAATRRLDTFVGPKR